jgi:imidazole glycerol-phosphate synthase subunit HisH
MIAIVNYGMGNLTSARMAIEHVGADVELTDDAETITSADGVVLPGVGAFPRAMDELKRRGLFEPVTGYARAGKPVLGICLGMQLLFESSTELGGAEGLGLLEGCVEALDADGLKVPQIGWNDVAWANGSALSAGLPEHTAMYHVHSFAARPADPSVVIGTAEYGERFATAVADRNVFGVQFHPEKSSAHGLGLLRNFVRLAS